MVALFSETVGSGEPTLVLLHGVSANGAVFKPLIRALGDWPGRIVVPDLRGHGRSPHAMHYGIGHHAADVADLFEPGTSVHLAGHSMGGAIALVLANGSYGVTVRTVTAFGLKVNWTPDEFTKGEAFAASPVRWFDTREAAAERFTRVAGLAGFVTDSDPVVDAGIRHEAGRYRLAADNATVRAAMGPTVAAMIAAACAPVRLFCGARDPMVTVAELRAFDPHAFAVDGCGHNPHVEAPEAVAKVVREIHGAR
jgi:pimeloyl-ACP methyl ester carboxylesterase